MEILPYLGPPLLYWEGGPRGEKAIHMLKPLLHGFLRNWSKNLLLHFYSNRTFEQIQKSLEVLSKGRHEEEDKTLVLETDSNTYKRYQTVTNIIENFDKHLPLSVLNMEQEKYIIMVTKNTYLTLSQVSAKIVRDSCGNVYFTW